MATTTSTSNAGPTTEGHNPVSTLDTIFGSGYFYLLIFAIVFLLRFGKQLAALIDRIQKGKVGPGGAEFESPIEKIPLSTPEEKPVSEAVHEEENKEKKEEEFSPKTYDEWETRMVFSALIKDKKQFEEAHLELLKLCYDPTKTKQSEINYWQWKHTLGETEAITKIKEFAKDPEVEYDAKMALGFCYSNSKDFETSALFYEETQKLAKSEKDTVRAADGRAGALSGGGHFVEAESVLERTLSEISEGENKVIIYNELADLYEKEKDYEKRALVIEKALMLRPNDTSLIFKAGYSYSNSRNDELSLFHYLNARKINPEDGSVRNNLGVQYERLGMPLKSVVNYEMAAKQSETLALSNLAYRLMDAGFEEEARKRLDEAQKIKDPHANVAQAVSDLSKRKEKEEERESEVIKTALAMRKFLLSFGDAKYTPSGTLSLLAGDWKLVDEETIFHVVIQGNKIIAMWKEKISVGSEYFYDFKLEGEIHNNSSEVKITRDARTYGQGKIFCTKDGIEIQFMSTSDYRSKQILRLQKN